MKRIHEELTYPGATVDDVVAMISDPSFRELVADNQGVVRRQVSVTGEVPLKTVRVELAHGTSRAPSFARKLAGDEIPIVQVETWTTDTAATVDVTITGKPGQMQGTAAIEERGNDVVETYDLTVTVKVPLVGGKLEEFIAGLLVKAFRVENKIGLKWLAGERS